MNLNGLGLGPAAEGGTFGRAGYSPTPDNRSNREEAKPCLIRNQESLWVALCFRLVFLIQVQQWLPKRDA